MGMFDIDRARKLLNEAHVFFGEDEEIPELAQTLNMNDTWAWACSDSQYVKDEELPEVAELFWRYGNCGILYWVSRKNENCRSEFLDYNRMIDFVAHEEQLRKDEPSDSQRGYKKLVYTLGGGMAVTLIWYIVVGVIAGILGNFMLQSYNSHFVGISFALSVNTVFFILRNRL